VASNTQTQSPRIKATDVSTYDEERFFAALRMTAKNQKRKAESEKQKAESRSLATVAKTATGPG
jgi:hypothetical protein